MTGRFSLRRLAAAALAAWGLAASAVAQQPASAAAAPEPPASAATATTADEPSFSLDIRAPGPVRTLLERHLELRRYREVADLDDAELARLITLAERHVRELVGTLGYFNPRVAIRREDGTGRRPAIVVEVEPGEATRVGSVKIDFEGDIAQSSEPAAVAQREDIRSGWRLPVGHSFTQEAWDGAKTRAVRQLIARRYPAGRATYSLADIDAPAGRAHLGLKLDSGPVFRLGAMQISGIQRYDSRLVPRLARLPAGSVYDQESLVQAQLRLSGSGYYDSAFIFVDPEGDPRAAPVQVTVREAPLQKVIFGLGLSTDSGARASVEYRHNRVPGMGWRAVTKMQAERKAPFIETEWTAIPAEDGWRWGVLARAERLDDGVLVTHGQRLRMGRTWAGEHIERNVYAQFDRATVRAETGTAPVAVADSGDGTAVSANYVWTGRYFDRSPYPSRGFGVGFELGGGLTLTGSKSPFQRTVVRWLGIRPLEQGRVQMRAEAGAVLARSSARVPSTQLFRTGGDTTVRGYGLRDIGVERAGGVISPGRFMAAGSAEWQRPIRRNGLETQWEGTVFIDGGAVSDRVSSLKPVFGVGVGVRFKSPLGPLQADLAYGVEPRRLRLHLNIGVTF
ncbi:MAG TPA: BamA/TamA family outer membrane protein [Ramlibacter sp.]|nr:BamA/TamA family outer membrane protein [Ramlibacter sp.]